MPSHQALMNSQPATPLASPALSPSHQLAQKPRGGSCQAIACLSCTSGGPGSAMELVLKAQAAVRTRRNPYQQGGCGSGAA